MKTVYCIIVTYNGMQWIDRCIQSLLDSLYKVSVIVIDNGSKDQTVSHIQTQYPSVKLIKAESNLGFGQGNNIGLKIAVEQNADYVFLLNQDAWVEADTIEKLVNAHSKNLAYGIISPMHLNGAGNNFDDHFLNYLENSGTNGFSWHHFQNKSFNTNIIDTPFVNAAAWLISKSCLLKVGGFDPIFFHYGEDDNYGQRVVYKGYKIGILPTASIYHDKERMGLKKTENVKNIVKKDWTQFLVYACNVNAETYKQLMIKRAGRHSLQLAAAVVTFKRDKIIYNFSMALKIFSSFKKVKQSRRISIKDTVTPHL